MAQFEIEVIETLSRIVTVDAPDSESAIAMVVKQHENEDIVLSSNDFIGVDFQDTADCEANDE